MTGESGVAMETLLSQYQSAVKAGLVEDALTLGELYFNSLHDGEMTCEDREQLQKDILYCVSIRDKIE